METILVTGSAGFIGFHVAQRLLADGYQVVGVDNLNDYYDPALKEARNSILLQNPNYDFYKIDIADYQALKKIFSEHSFFKICHLAAQAGVRYSLENPFAYLKSNIDGTLNILELAKDYDIKDIVYASSSSVYGKNEKVPFAESDPVDNPISLYAATKKSNELMAYTYHNLYGLNLVGLRFFTVYGPWGRPDMALFKFTRNILAGKPIDIYNNGNMERDFTYIDDIVEGVIAALDKVADLGYEILNLGNSNPQKLGDFIACIEQASGKQAVKNLMPMQPGDVPRTYADLTKSQRLLGYKPTTAMEQGIPKFVQWYRDYYAI